MRELSSSRALAAASSVAAVAAVACTSHLMPTRRLARCVIQRASSGFKHRSQPAAGTPSPFPCAARRPECTSLQRASECLGLACRSAGARALACSALWVMGVGAAVYRSAPPASPQAPCPSSPTTTATPRAASPRTTAAAPATRRRCPRTRCRSSSSTRYAWLLFHCQALPSCPFQCSVALLVMPTCPDPSSLPLHQCPSAARRRHHPLHRGRREEDGGQPQEPQRLRHPPHLVRQTLRCCCCCRRCCWASLEPGAAALQCSELYRMLSWLASEQRTAGCCLPLS